MVWLFNRKPNYERELPALAAQIRASQLRQLRLQAQHRRVAGLFLLYAAMVCVIIGLAVTVVPQFSSRKHRILGAVLPFVVYVVKRALDRWYKWRIDRQERTLASITERRKVLAEEYKEQTNYYKIRDLVDLPEPEPNVEDVNPPPSRPSPADTNIANETNNTVAADGQLPEGPPPLGSGSDIPLGESTRYIPTESKPSWMDRILDIILGENEQSANNRFALICAYCHAHNGLAVYGQTPSQVKYRCRLCGQLNPPPELEPVTETTSLLEPTENPEETHTAAVATSATTVE